MSGSEDGEGELFVGLLTKGPDGRFREARIIPGPQAEGDQVLFWGSGMSEPAWVPASDLGFTPEPLIMDVPVVDGTGAQLTEADGTRIVANVRSGS